MNSELDAKIKALQAEFAVHCDKYEHCDKCTYCGYDCHIAFVVDNYELTKKPNKELLQVNEILDKYSIEHTVYCNDRECETCELHLTGDFHDCYHKFILAKERGIL